MWYPSLLLMDEGSILNQDDSEIFFYLHVTELELFSVEGQSRLHEAVPFRFHLLLVTDD